MTLSGRIYLIGLPGSGKSYFARKLSDHFRYAYVDLDREIEERAGAKIPQIFADRGEDYFRKLEADTLREVTNSHTNLIISTGGGTPCFYDSMDFMNEKGTTVFLETDRKVLVERLLKKTDRPLMQGDVVKKIEELWSARRDDYQKARITISHRDPDLLASEIAELKN